MLDPNQSNDAVPAIGFTSGAIVVTEMPDPDGTADMHVLSEGEARGAIDRYNAALREKLAHDLGES